MQEPRLILASRSPRRASLLREAGYAFEQQQSLFDDPPHPGEGDPAAVAIELARRKATSFPSEQVQGAVILAADTLIAFPDGSLAGTPTSRDEARAMIERFAKRDHAVVTGVTLLGPGRGQLQSFAVSSTVHMGAISPEQLQSYLATDHWQGKAGGYNLFERVEAGWPIRVEGSVTNVVGLPMEEVSRRLDTCGIRPRRLRETGR